MSILEAFILFFCTYRRQAWYAGKLPSARSSHGSATKVGATKFSEIALVVSISSMKLLLKTLISNTVFLKELLI